MSNQNSRKPPSVHATYTDSLDNNYKASDCTHQHVQNTTQFFYLSSSYCILFHVYLNTVGAFLLILIVRMFKTICQQHPSSFIGEDRLSVVIEE